MCEQFNNRSSKYAVIADKVVRARRSRGLVQQLQTTSSCQRVNAIRLRNLGLINASLRGKLFAEDRATVQLHRRDESHEL